MDNDSQKVSSVRMIKPYKPSLLLFVVKVLFYILLLYWALVIFTSPNPWIFIDYANLLGHEIGHFAFSLFGEFASFLGGTILQTLIPLCFFGYFVIHANWFSAAFCGFWFGEVLVNVGNYMADARAQLLPLAIPGSIHDWGWIFTQLNILDYDQVIGGVTKIVGLICIVGSLGWIGWKLLIDAIELFWNASFSET